MDSSAAKPASSNGIAATTKHFGNGQRSIPSACCNWLRSGARAGVARNEDDRALGPQLVGAGGLRVDAGCWHA
eukprot:12858921-Alexandrium_andersonii.AAC.1